MNFCCSIYCVDCFWQKQWDAGVLWRFLWQRFFNDVEWQFVWRCCRRFPVSSQSSLWEESSVAEYFTDEAEDIICEKRKTCLIDGILLGSFFFFTNSVILMPAVHRYNAWHTFHWGKTVFMHMLFLTVQEAETSQKEIQGNVVPYCKDRIQNLGWFWRKKVLNLRFSKSIIDVIIPGSLFFEPDIVKVKLRSLTYFDNMSSHAHVFIKPWPKVLDWCYWNYTTFAHA